MKIQEERVLLLMEENGITQREMARDLAISPTTLNGYLHGKYLHVPDDVICEIADYLRVSVDYITDRSALLQIGNGIHDKEEAVVIDNYRHLRPSDKKIAADLMCCPAAGIAAGQAVLRGWVGAAGWGLVVRREVGEWCLPGSLRPGQVRVPGFRGF